MKYLEDKEQKAFFSWCRDINIISKYPELRFIHSSQSGMKFKNALAGARAKATGMLAGVPDIFLPVMRGGFGGLYIEMKRPKVGSASKGVLSTSQKEFIEYATSAGYAVKVCYGAKEAIEAVVDYMQLQRMGR